jgi:hypothetical protein
MKENIQIEKFKVIPDPKLYGKLGQVGYSLRDAICELVDNSIDSRVEGKKLNVEIDLDEENQVIRIKDDGKGMSKENIKDAIILGKSDKKDKLGFFGLGLKTAGLSLGNIITIKSRSERSEQVHMIEFDRTDFEKRSDWELQVKSLGDDLFGKGTTIILNDLLVRLNYSKADRLNNFFAERYKSFINSGELNLSVNSFKCEPNKPTYIMEEKISLKTKRGDRITGYLRIQTKRLQRTQEYGFDLYKHGRIISSNDKIGFNGLHGEKALICGELNLDFCDTVYTKNAFIKGNLKYSATNNEIKEYLKPLFPLFTTKNLKKDLIDGLLQIQKETGKIPNLEEFKKQITKIKGGKIVINDEEKDKIKIEVLETKDLISIPKSAELISHIEMHSDSLGKFSKAIEAIKKSNEDMKQISESTMTQALLEGYVESLTSIAKQTRTLLGGIAS